MCSPLYLFLTSTPRRSSPFLLLVVPKDGTSGLSLDEVTSANTAAMCESLKALKVDQIIAVDLGGDSLTGGVDFEGGSFEFGRDRQVLHALAASGIPFSQIVFGPGCDGESSIEAMQKAVKSADDAGKLLGLLPLDDLVPRMAEMAKTLRENRTPNILARAMAVVQRQTAKEAMAEANAEAKAEATAEAETASGAAGGSAGGRKRAKVSQVEDEDEEAQCVIERHGNKTVVPWSWLTIGLVIKGGAT